MKEHLCTRRDVLRWGVTLAAGAPFAMTCRPNAFAAEAPAASPKASSKRSDAKVAMVGCRSYGPEVRIALQQCFDLLGGINSLVKNKTVTVKVNLTGTNFVPFLDRPVGETYMTHPATATALVSLLF